MLQTSDDNIRLEGIERFKHKHMHFASELKFKENNSVPGHSFSPE